MAKLTRKDKKRIASLINSLQCVEMRKRDARGEENYEELAQQLKREDELTEALYREFDIELPCLRNSAKEAVLAERQELIAEWSGA